MKSQTLTSVCALAMALLAATTAHSQGIPILQHLGSTDPTTEGFDLSIDIGGSVVPLADDLGTSAWMTANSPKSGTLEYSQALTLQQQAALTGADWSLLVDFRVVQSWGTFENFFCAFSVGQQLFQLGFGLDADSDPFVRVGPSTQREEYVLDGAGSTYNTYRLDYHASSETARLWIDGTEVLSGIVGQTSNQASLLTWGLGQTGGSPIQANWSLVSLQTVPEPSSLAVLLVAGGMAFLRYGTTSGFRKPAAQQPDGNIRQI